MQPKPANRRLIYFIGLAILIHLAFFPLLGPLVRPGGTQASENRRIQVVSIRQTKTRPAKHKLSKAQPQQKKKAKKKSKPKKRKQFDEDWRQKKQVYVPPTLDTTAPKDSKFVSEHNSKTAKETISRHARTNPETVLNELSVAKKQAKPTTQTGLPEPKIALQPNRSQPKTESAEPKKAKARFEIPKVGSIDALALKLDPKLGQLNNRKSREQRHGNSTRLRLSDGDTQQKDSAAPPRSAPVPGTNKNLNLVPDLAVLARISGAPDLQLLDEDIEEGEGTFLNSAAFKYGSFFRRVRSRIGAFWNPIPELNRRDPTGAVFGRRDRITEVRMTLDRVGKLTDVQISITSGLDFLDQEALSALKRAKQFPNMPQDLLSAENTYTFSFRFHVIRNRTGRYQLPF